MEHKRALLGKTLAGLEQVAAELSMPGFAARQLAGWLYRRRVADIGGMSNLSAAHRAMLAERYDVGVRPFSAAQESKDGAQKYLFAVGGEKRAYVESVLIPEAGRATLCLSSQAGCPMGCKFCMTARMGFRHNLTSGEIINQIFGVPRSGQLTNLVFMGMGEPMSNIDSLLESLEVITAPWGMGWSPARVTVSTVGVLPALRRFLDESRCHLAVSLHSPFADERRALMPVQKAFPAEDVVALIRRYRWTGQRRVSFEYILFDGLNDTPRHAAALARLLGGFECRVNLIRFHRIPGSELRGSPPQAMERFKEMLLQRGLLTTIRASRGEDILAACGMLSAGAELPGGAS
ncbi:MAG: 23S rRNA (adenine(2503)-C(2))-methyltransferase RlmN [Prevotellaceae bacterium]|jgi:23S rRNA (adenine2503-C2)-methyltransferase|nr:23S rRNA (adenine(2503)-C(2))-methyltransferase RlmN [Prevotellaceae bacterium]